MRHDIKSFAEIPVENPGEMLFRALDSADDGKAT